MSNDESTIDPVRKTRRDMLKTAGVVAGAAVAGKLAAADSASAADGQALVVAANNSATNLETGLTTGGPNQAPEGFKAFKVVAPNFDYGVSGDAKNYGVVGTGAGGVLGLGTVGGVFSGSVVAINLDPQPDPQHGGPVNAPTGQAFQGDLAVNSAGILWFCVADSPAGGGPGTWIKLSHGGSRILPSPIRAYSTTDVVGGAKMNQGETRTVPLAGVVSGVPSNALGLIVNITAHQTVSGGYVIVYPAGTSRPATSNINWSTTGTAIANGATVGVGNGGAISIFADAAVPASSPATHVIIDVAGYIL